MLTWVTAWNGPTFSVSLCLHLHPSSSLCIWICFSFPWVKEVFFKKYTYIYTPFQAHWVTLRSYFMRMTGLLPVCASLCVYCLWVEMKRGSAARLGTAGGMLAGTAGVALPNAHTQRSHQNKQISVQLCTLLPPTLFQRVINLLFFFSTPCHFSLCTQRWVRLSLCPLLLQFSAYFCSSQYLYCLCKPIIFSYLCVLTPAASLTLTHPFLYTANARYLDW